jgi:hypothetical protein
MNSIKWFDWPCSLRSSEAKTSRSINGGQDVENIVCVCLHEWDMATGLAAPPSVLSLHSKLADELAILDMSVMGQYLQ